jgi:hypothetical protein
VAITKQLVEIRETVTELLKRLGNEGAELAEAVRRGRAERVTSKPKGAADKPAASEPPDLEYP